MTSWDYQSFLVKTGHVAMHKHIIPGEGPEAFADPAALSACIEVTSSCPIRYPVPGETGTRNAFRGDGFFGIDSGLNKTFHLTEQTSLKFDWEVFNVTNTPRFDVNPNTSLQAVWGSGDFGVYSNVLGRARIQQFSYEPASDSTQLQLLISLAGDAEYFPRSGQLRIIIPCSPPENLHELSGQAF